MYWDTHKATNWAKNHLDCYTCSAFLEHFSILYCEHTAKHTNILSFYYISWVTSNIYEILRLTNRFLAKRWYLRCVHKVSRALPAEILRKYEKTHMTWLHILYFKVWKSLWAIKITLGAWNFYHYLTHLWTALKPIFSSLAQKTQSSSWAM